MSALVSARREGSVILARPATFPEVVQGLIDKLGREEEYESSDAVEAAEEFLLCFRRFESVHALWHLCRKNCRHGNTPSIRGALRLLRIWLMQHRARDFPKKGRAKKHIKKAAHTKPSGKSHHILSSLMNFVLRLSKKRNQAIIFDVNRLKLALLRHEELPLSLVDSLPKAKVTLKFFGLNVEEVAQHLTQLEHHARFDTTAQTLRLMQMFKQFRLSDFVTKSTPVDSTSQEATMRPSLLARFVTRSDEISSWVASCILSQVTAGNRIRAAQRFVVIAEFLERYGNYNSLMEILGGFNLWCISRIRKSISIGDKYANILGRLQRVMSPDNNYAQYRQVLTYRLTSNEPTIPYVGIFLKDITFIEDGNIDIVEGGKMNMQKVGLLGRTLRTVRACQRQPYRTFPVQISALMHLLSAPPRMSEEQLTAASEAIRPRQALTSEPSSENLLVSSSSGVMRVGSSEQGDAMDASSAEGSERSEAASDMVELAASPTMPGTYHGQLPTPRIDSTPRTPRSFDSTARSTPRSATPSPRI